MAVNGELHSMSRDELHREYLRGRLQEAEGRALKTSARAEIDRRFPKPPGKGKGKVGKQSAQSGKG